MSDYKGKTNNGCEEERDNLRSHAEASLGRLLSCSEWTALTQPAAIAVMVLENFRWFDRLYHRWSIVS